MGIVPSALVLKPNFRTVKARSWDGQTYLKLAKLHESISFRLSTQAGEVVYLVF